VKKVNFRFESPNVDFSFNNNACPNTSVNFNNLTTSNFSNLTYSWDFGDGSPLSTQENPSHTYSSIGNYTVTLTATDPNGCDSSVSKTINVDIPDADAGPDVSVCNGISTVIGGSPTTNAAGATFLWNNGATLSSTTIANPTATPTVNTTYTVTVTDVNGCTNTDQVTVSVNSPPTADAGNNQTICNGDSVTLGGSPTGPAGATYLWSNATTLDEDTVANPIASPSVTTTYTVTVTNGISCTATDQVTITVVPDPTADAGTDQTLCLGASVTIGGSPTGPTGATYAWNNATSLNNASLANPSASPGATTTYTVTVTSVNGCTDTDQMTVTVNSGPTADAGSNQTICNGNSVTLGGSPTGPAGATYAWSNSTSLNNASAANPVATPATTTTYTVTVTDGSGCTDTDQVTVTVNPTPAADAGSDQTICSSGSVTIGGSPTGSAGSTFAWNNGGSLSSTTAANPIANPTTTTTYTVTVTDGNGCTSTDQLTVTVNSLPTADAGADQTICSGSSATIGGSPTGPTGSTFSWNNAASLNNSSAANPIASPTTTTTYTVTVTDVNGCTNTDQITVSVVAIPSADAGSDQTICQGNSVTLGGSPTYRSNFCLG